MSKLLPQPQIQTDPQSILNLMMACPEAITEWNLKQCESATSASEILPDATARKIWATSMIAAANDLSAKLNAK